MIITESELYQVIGELFVARAKTDVLYKQALVQIEEMSRVISVLRREIELQNLEKKELEDGKLVGTERKI